MARKGGGVGSDHYKLLIHKSFYLKSRPIPCPAPSAPVAPVLMGPECTGGTSR
jgi:hypothetical protein